MPETKVDKSQLDEEAITDIQTDGSPVKADTRFIDFQDPLEATVDGDGVEVSITSIEGLPGAAGDAQVPTTHSNTKHSPAMMENAANKFTAYDEKTDPHDDDIILLEDSEDSFNKKKMKKGSAFRGAKFRVGWSMGDLTDAVHHLAGVHEQDITGQQVNATSPTVDDMNRFMLMVEVTTLTTSGTLRITGTSYDPSTGGTTPSDTEDIVVGTTGWYCSMKHWEGTITLSAIGGLDVIVDGYRFYPYGTLMPNAKLTHIHYTASGGTGSPSLQVEAWKLDKAAKTFTSIFDDTQVVSAGTALHNHRHIDIDIDFTSGESIYFRATSNKIFGMQFELGFTRL